MRGVFEKVAPTYDLMNDLMSAGVHRVWKDYLVSKVGVFPGMTHLDVAGGTGDVAFRVLRALRAAEATARRGGAAASSASDGSPGTFKAGKVIVSDINPWMLGEGEKRAEKLGLTRAVDARGESLASLSFVEGNAECLPFDDESVDVYTIAFGLRNVTNTLAALKDAHRLLKVRATGRGGKLGRGVAGEKKTKSRPTRVARCLAVHLHHHLSSKLSVLPSTVACAIPFPISPPPG